MKPEEVVADALPAAAAKVGWTGAVLASLGALSLTEWMAVGGFLVALIGSLGGLVLNAYFRWRRDRREQALYDMHAAEVLARDEGRMPDLPFAKDTES